MGAIKQFEDIVAWQQASELVREVYKSTSKGDFQRDFGLRDQIRRSSISVVSNIAEGFERGGDKEFIQFLYIAKGSSGELRAQLHVARDLDYLTVESYRHLRELAIKSGELIFGIIRYLKKSEFKGKKFK